MTVAHRAAMPARPGVQPQRENGLDALRGFALLGIVVVNAPFFASPLGGATIGPGVADALAEWIVIAFGAGKFFLIFSLLFGYGIAELAARAKEQERSTAALRRRLAALFIIGVVHGVFLFYGDILMLYAVIGAALLPLSRASPPALRTVTITALILGVASQNVVFTLGATLVPEGADLVPKTGYLGSFLDAAAARAADLPIAQIGVLMFNAVSALAMAVLGLLWHRGGGVDTVIGLASRHSRAMRRAAIAAALVSAVAGLVIVLAMRDPGSIGLGVSIASAAAVSLAAPILSAALVLACLRRTTQDPDAASVAALAALGRTSLSGYLLHSVLLSAVFNGWGLGLLGTVGSARVLLLSFAVYAAMLCFAVAWQQWFRLGPAEWVLRSVAALRPIPLMR
ncbi:DUF418 domain-containing protein [Elioraea sp.]|uniref:DUF418 domain-containing protein n=1 Tax=Elioraea sp. TaxID=2185103 RepID=UPI0025BDEBEC|nr:DUF418 domain-containing protein [Elioraea sp.]